MLRRRPSHVAVAAALVGFLAAPQARAAEPSGEDPVELIKQGRHLEAAEAFERKYQQTHDGALLFAKATALRRGGDCRGAIEALRRFIGTEPPASDIAAAQEVIDVCTAILEDGETPPEPPPPIPVEPPPPEPLPPESPPPERSWTRDVTGGVLLGTGVGVTVAGAVLVGLGASRTQDREESEAGFERREQSVRTLYAVGGATAAAGVALLIGSIVRYTIVARRSERRTTARVRSR